MRPGQPGPLLHPARDLAGELLQVVQQADHLGVGARCSRISRSDLLGVLPEREGDVVVQVHRPEQGPVLEEDAELAADPVEVLLPHADDLLAVDPDLARVGSSSPRMFLSRTDFPVPEGRGWPVILPLGTSKLMSSSTVCEPKRLGDPAQGDDRLSRGDPGPNLAVGGDCRLFGGWARSPFSACWCGVIVSPLV